MQESDKPELFKLSDRQGSTISTDEVMAIVGETITRCKEEVDEVVGKGFIESKDGGSPWARVFMEIMSLVIEAEKAEVENEQQHQDGTS